MREPNIDAAVAINLSLERVTTNVPSSGVCVSIHHLHVLVLDGKANCEESKAVIRHEGTHTYMHTYMCVHTQLYTCM